MLFVFEKENAACEAMYGAANKPSREIKLREIAGGSFIRTHLLL